MKQIELEHKIPDLEYKIAASDHEKKDIFKIIGGHEKSAQKLQGDTIGRITKIGLGHSNVGDNSNAI